MKDKIIFSAVAGAAFMLALTALGVALMGGFWWVTWTMPDFSLAVVMKIVRGWVAVWALVTVGVFLTTLND